MKKLLVIAPQNPYPAIDGGKISIYYPLIHLADFFEIHFVFPAEGLSKDVESHFSKFGIKIYPQEINTKDSITGIFLNLFCSRPYKFQKYHKSKTLEKIKEIVQKESIEFVWCNHCHTAWYGLELQKTFDVKIFLREHNIEYSLVQQVMALKKPGLVKIFILWQYLKTKRYEINCWKKFHKTFFISDADFNIAKSNCVSCDGLYLLYDGFKEKKEYSIKTREPYSFIFTGSVETFQNAYNLEKFISDIWKPLIKKDSRWKLYITGNKDEIIKRTIKTHFSSNNIKNLGFVDDVDAVIGSKKYFISPTYIGSGLRIKVINAMSCGAVCFLSTLDASMLSVFRNFVNMIDFNNFTDFYHNLMKLESDEFLYNSISLQALNAGTNFTWSNYAIKANNEITGV